MLSWWGVAPLWWRNAAVDGRSAGGAWWRRNLEARSAGLLWDVLLHEHLGVLINGLTLVLLLLLRVLDRHALVDVVGLLASERVIDRVKPSLGAWNSSNNWLHLLLKVLNLLLVLLVLLPIHGITRSNWWSSKVLRLLLLHAVHSVQVHALELLSCGLNIDELLLKTLLLLGQIHVCSDQLGVQVWVHLLLAVLVDVNLWWSKNLLRKRVHLAVAVIIAIALLVLSLPLLLAESRTDRGLWSTVAHALVLLVVIVNAGLKSAVLRLSWWSGRWREVAGSGRLWSGPQTRKQVRTASAWSWSTIVLDGRLGGREGETLEVGTFSASSEAGAWDTDGVKVVVVLIRHLRKTASVHAQNLIMLSDTVQLI